MDIPATHILLDQRFQSAEEALHEIGTFLVDQKMVQPQYINSSSTRRCRFWRCKRIKGYYDSVCGCSQRKAVVMLARNCFFLFRYPKCKTIKRRRYNRGNPKNTIARRVEKGIY